MSKHFGWISVMVAAGAIGVVVFALAKEAASFAMVAALVLVGIVSFTGFVSVLSVTAGRLGLLDARHPFGLPEGSIRAILTFAFIVLVGVFASYLLVQTSRSPFDSKHSGFILPAITATDAQEFQRQIAGEGIVVLKDNIYTFIPRTDYRLADDVAKQILTMLSTMLAAMIGFYFGSRPNEAGNDPYTAERLRTAAELDGLRTSTPSLDDVKAAAEAIDTAALPDDKKALLADTKARIAALGQAVEDARIAARDPLTPIDKLRTLKTAALDGYAGLPKQLQAIEALAAGG